MDICVRSYKHNSNYPASRWRLLPPGRSGQPPLSSLKLFFRKICIQYGFAEFSGQWHQKCCIHRANFPILLNQQNHQVFQTHHLFAVCCVCRLIAQHLRLHGPRMSTYLQDSLPDSIKVPMEAVGVGEITHKCRDKANAPGITEWVFVGPNAVLNDSSGKQLG